MDKWRVEERREGGIEDSSKVYINYPQTIVHDYATVT